MDGDGAEHLKAKYGCRICEHDPKADCTVLQQRGITLGGLQAVDIQIFYASQLKRVSANTVIHYHAIIHRALKYAVKTDLIDVNPADKVERPRKTGLPPRFMTATK